MTSNNLLVNIGCGPIHHKDWVNLDILPSEDVKVFNIKQKLPFEDNSVDVVYHSHLLEHLDKVEGSKFIKECFRILKPKGVIRIAVPDLEQICREYLLNLDKAFESGDKETIVKHNWNVLELFDQMTRTESGGNIIKTIREGRANKDYAIKRNGSEVSNVFDQPNSINENKKINFIKKIYKSIFSHKYNPQKNGESHKWMYDKLSLSLLLKDSGFNNVVVRDFNTSYIEDWNKYKLDSTNDGLSARKPDSLFIEAIK